RVLAVESDTDVATRRPRRAEGDGANSELSKGSFYGTVVTLEVTPGQAEIVSLAARVGHVDLGLRNGTDDQSVATVGAVVAQFSRFEDDQQPGATPGAKPTPTQTVPGQADKKGRRGIQLRAVDASREGRENPGKEIETYHAR